MMWSLCALALGFVIDLILGDPHSVPHPVVLIGKLISVLEKVLRRVFPKTVLGENIAGGVLWLTVVVVSTALPIALLRLCHWISPWLRLAVESVMCWQILATKSLRDESMKVYHALKTGDIEASRYAVSMIVGRDTDRLDDAGVTRAAVETVAENTSDGVIAPLMYTAAISTVSLTHRASRPRSCWRFAGRRESTLIHWVHLICAPIKNVSMTFWLMPCAAGWIWNSSIAC